MTKQVDIAGGGVAGLALGLALRQEGIPVCVHEAGTYPRHRLCGEFLSGVGAEEFNALGLGELLAECAPLRDVAWFLGDRLILRDTLPDTACGISRWRLDAAMAARLTAIGGTVSCDDRVRTPDNSEGWVAATGRAPAGAGKWYAEKEHYQEMPASAGLEMHLSRGSYAGLAPVGNGVVNVCALLPAEAGKGRASTFAGRLRTCGFDRLAARLDAARAVPFSRCGAPRFATGWQSPRDGTLRIGDCAAVIAPFSGHGLSMAILAGLHAAPPLADWSRGRLSWSETVQVIETGLRRRFRVRLRWAAWLHPLLLRPAGQLFLRLLSRSGFLPWRWLYHKMR